MTETIDTPPKKKRGILDLGEDLIASEIIPNLSPKDIKSLGLTCHYLNAVTNESSVWHHLFEKTFGIEPTPFAFSNYKWPDLFNLRKSLKLLTWGKSSGGRLGFSIRDIPREHVSRRSLESSVNKPTVVSNLQDSTIADVSAGGFSFQILTAEGELYTTGVTWNGGLNSGPGPDSADNLPGISVPTTTAGSLPRYTPVVPEMGGLFNFPFRLGGVIPRRNSPFPIAQPPAPGQLITPLPTQTQQHNHTTDMPEREVHHTAPDLRDEEDKQPLDSKRPSTADGFVRRLKVNPKIVAVSSGRTHFIALDENGEIWSWDHQRQGLVGVKLKFIDANEKNLVSNTNIITKIVAGWNLSCCYILNVGIVYWTGRDAFQDPSVSIEDSPVNTHFKIVANTAAIAGPEKIVDIVAGESFIVYLTLQGKIYRLDINDDSTEPYELNRFNSYLAKHSQSSATPSKFVRLSGGSYRTFVAISDEDQVLIGTKDSNNPEIIRELQKTQIISVGVGDYHCLALTKSGELLSWGLESLCCGCLGLGESTPFVESGVGEIVGRNGFRVHKPTKVDIQGKVLAIGAAGWQSCAIVNVNE